MKIRSAGIPSVRANLAAEVEGTSTPSNARTSQGSKRALTLAFHESALAELRDVASLASTTALPDNRPASAAIQYDSAR